MDKHKSMRLRNPVISKTSTHYITLEQGFRDFIKDLNKLQVRPFENLRRFCDVVLTQLAAIHRNQSDCVLENIKEGK